MSRPYGKELILDLHGCNTETFTRGHIRTFFVLACDKMGVSPQDRHYWDDVGVPEEERQTDPKLKGTSAIQFLLTSNITIHTLDLLGQVYINVFSCGEFKSNDIEHLAIALFGGRTVQRFTVDRK